MMSSIVWKRFFITVLLYAELLASTYAFSATYTNQNLKSPNVAIQNSINKLTYSPDVSITGRSPNTSLNALAPSVAAAGILYKKSLTAFPMTTKLTTGGILALIGDAIAQSHQNKAYDERSATSIVVFDIFYRSLQCVLFPLIVKLCQGQYFGKIFRNASANSLAAWEQTLVNQLIVIPVIYYPSFFFITGIIQNLSLQEMIDRGSQKMRKLLKRNWLFWIPVQFVQFRFVGEPYQIPFLCIVGLLWTFILSTSTGNVHREQAKKMAIS